MDPLDQETITTLLETIQDFADKQYQRKAWIYGIDNYATDYGENVCWLFDLLDPVIGSYERFELSPEKHLLFLQFRNIYNEFDANWEEQSMCDFIDSPEWDYVVRSAQALLNAFHYTGNNFSSDVPPMKVDRADALSRLLEAIRQLKDEDYRKTRVLLEGKEVNRYGVADIFFTIRGYTEPILDAYQKFGISEKGRDYLAKFYAKFKPLDERNCPPNEYMDTLEWDEVKDLATEVLKEIKPLQKRSCTSCFETLKARLASLLGKRD